MPTDDRFPWFVRQLTSNERRWCGGDGDLDALAKSGFATGSDEKVSVYSAKSDLEEARIIAALQAGRGRKATCYGLRIRAEDLTGLAIGIDDTQPGTTGVASVDVTHRDLVGAGDAFRELARRILAVQAEGEDRVRVLWDQQLLGRLRAFESEGQGEVTPAALRKLKLILKEASPPPGTSP